MAPSPRGPVRFRAYQDHFSSITGSTPESAILCESTTGDSLYHEACIYHAASKSVLVTSNQLPVTNGAGGEQTGNKRITLMRIYDRPDNVKAVQEEIVFSGIEGAMLNGGVNYGPDSILLCAQGSHNPNDISGIVELQLSSSQLPDSIRTEAAPNVIVADFYGIPFNSVNDVVVHPVDGSIWFTDPSYAFHQGIRTKPCLPNQVYRYDTKNGTIRAIADSFTRPNGICFSPDLRKLYITDTGYIHGSPDVSPDPSKPSSIYAFDIVHEKNSDESGTTATSSTYLINRRLFAFAPGRCPDGIKCDTFGNVYSGCLDGIAVWNQHGEPLGNLEVDGGVANFCFGEPGVIYACNETRFIRITIDSGVQGALLAGQRPST